MTEKALPINKGNYSMDTVEREALFERCRGEGWEEGYRQYRGNWSAYPEQQFVADYPLLVDLELASICNLKCPMCYTITPEFKEKVNTTLLDFGLFKKVIDEIGDKVPALRLSLRGEATLHPKFIECVRYAKSRGIKEISMLTHGGRFTPELFDAVAEAGLDWITISIDGLDDTYESIRRPLKFEETLQRLGHMRDHKLRHGLHRPVVKVQAIWPSIRNNPEAYYNRLKDYCDLLAFNPLIDYLGNDHDIVYLDDFRCPQQYQRLVAGADGLVMKCSNDEENREVVGDINRQGIHEIWHGEKLNAVREMHKRPRGFMESEVCRKCYLPRMTEDSESTAINGREIIIKNYVNRKQDIGG